MKLDQPNFNWYVVYTYPKAERKVDRKLREVGVITFLPLHKVMRQWSDRKKKLEVPLFPNYVFVYTPHKDRFKVFQVEEVVRFVSFGEQPAIIAEITIDSLKKMLKGDVEISDEQFQEGTIVKVKRGQFTDVEGILIRKNGKNRLLVKVDVLHTCISIDVGANDVEAVPSN